MYSRNHKLIGVYARGIGIGLADLVPGVSGGTIAFITGIYDRLIFALNLCVSVRPWLILARGEFRVFWVAVDGNFGLSLLAGIATAVFAGASAIRYLLLNHSAALLGCFCGFTLAAAITILRRLNKRNFKVIIAILLAMVVTAAIVLLAPVTLSKAPPLQGYFLAGALAFCALILPGISGSFILLIIGVYPYLIEAVHQRDLAVLAIFSFGGAVGLACTVKLLRRLLAIYPDLTIALLCGVMLGALPKLWPWKQQADNVNTILQPAVMPWQLAEPQYLIVIASAIFGFCVIIGAEFIALKTAKQ